MRLHTAHWDGPVRVILWLGGGIPFGQEVPAEDLGFELTLLEPGQEIGAEHLAGAGLVVASADMHQTLGLREEMRAARGKLTEVIEYTLDTRLRIVWLDRDLSWLRKLRSTLWHLGLERRRRAAFRAADGLQANGWPAETAYASLSRDCLLYLDGRMRPEMWLRLRKPLPAPRGWRPGRRFASCIGSARFLKGSHDLIPVARALTEAGVDFTLDIWGTGLLAPQIAQEIAAARLATG